MVYVYEKDVKLNLYKVGAVISTNNVIKGYIFALRVYMSLLYILVLRHGKHSPFRYTPSRGVLDGGSVVVECAVVMLSRTTLSRTPAKPAAPFSTALSAAAPCSCACCTPYCCTLYLLLHLLDLLHPFLLRSMRLHSAVAPAAPRTTARSTTAAVVVAAPCCCTCCTPYCCTLC
jgi:hypothetical protein